MTTREEDYAEDLFVASTHDYILFFTSKGKVYRLKGYEVPEGSRTSKGMNIINLIEVEQDENITAMIRVHEYDDDKFLTMATRARHCEAHADARLQHRAQGRPARDRSSMRTTSWSTYA